MSKLIRALEILQQYGNPDDSIRCEHGELIIIGIQPKYVNEKDLEKLNELGFIVKNGQFVSSQIINVSHYDQKS